MPNGSEQQHSFVVRIWREEGDLWRGWVQHTSTREQTYVQNLPDLLAFIQARTGELVSRPETPGEMAEATGGQPPDQPASNTKGRCAMDGE